MSDTDGGEFLLSSPSYRIEKARLRYENLLLSLDDDSVDDAERHMSVDCTIDDTILESNEDETFESFRTSQLESKQSHDAPHTYSRSRSQPSVSLQNGDMKSPITDIYKSVTRRYVIDKKGPAQNMMSSSAMNSAMEKGSINRKHVPSPAVNHQQGRLQYGNNESKHANRDVILHENDDIIIAQQSEIEMLKYELNALKESSAKEIHSLKKLQQDTQNILDTERNTFSTELTTCKSELTEFKALYKKTKDELDVDKNKLKQALRHLERITRRGNALHSVKDGSFSCYKQSHHHSQHHQHQQLT